jgi:hypothetical protein
MDPDSMALWIRIIIQVWIELKCWIWIEDMPDPTTPGFQECVSGFADFKDVSGLAIGGLKIMKINGLAFSRFKEK